MFIKQVKNILTVRSNISVIFPDATRYTERHLIYALIYDGIQVNGPLFVRGCIVANDSLDPMSCRGIVELTLARNDSSVQNATKDSCEAIIYRSTSRLITKLEVNTIRRWK